MTLRALVVLPTTAFTRASCQPRRRRRPASAQSAPAERRPCVCARRICASGPDADRRFPVLKVAGVACLAIRVRATRENAAAAARVTAVSVAALFAWSSERRSWIRCAIQRRRCMGRLAVVGRGAVRRRGRRIRLAVHLIAGRDRPSHFRWRVAPLALRRRRPVGAVAGVRELARGGRLRVLATGGERDEGEGADAGGPQVHDLSRLRRLPAARS